MSRDYQIFQQNYSKSDHSTNRGPRRPIIREIKEVKYFSILCDEVTDNANLEQLSFVLRFVNR